MQNQYKPAGYARLNNFHGPKRQLLGNHAGQAPPAWRTTAAAQQGNGPMMKGKPPTETGSRIFLSRLPVDVVEKEVEELFSKTVGPVKESFLVYNSQGKSKGMAVVTFHRPGDALAARAKYDGKVVDGRRPIKIEILLDGNPTVASVPAPRPTPTLLNRLAPPTEPLQNVVSNPTPTAPRKQPHQSNYTQAKQATAHAAPVKKAPIPPRRFKQKKGPKRLKKRAPATIVDLDKEMEDYRASAPEYLEL